MSHGTCKTVQVVADNAQGFVVINLSDFNAEIHKVFGESDVATAKAELDASVAEAQAQAQAKIDQNKAQAAHDTVAAQAAGVPIMVQAPWLKPSA